MVAQPGGSSGRNPGWDRLAETIREELNANASAAGGKQAPATQAELASTLNLPSAEVRNWLRGTKNLRFGQIPEIAQALAASYEAPEQRGREVLQRLAAALFNRSRDAAEMAFAVHRLQTRLIEMRQDIAHVAVSAGVPATAARAIKSGWALAIWPAHEGPAGGPILHVDRSVYAFELQRLRDARELGDDIAASYAEHGVLRVDAELPNMEGMSIEHQRAYRWQQCFGHTLEGVQYLIDTQRIPSKALTRWWAETLRKDGPATRENAVRQWLARVR